MVRFSEGVTSANTSKRAPSAHKHTVGVEQGEGEALRRAGTLLLFGWGPLGPLRDAESLAVVLGSKTGM